MQANLKFRKYCITEHGFSRSIDSEHQLNAKKYNTDDHFAKAPRNYVRSQRTTNIARLINNAVACVTMWCCILIISYSDIVYADIICNCPNIGCEKQRPRNCLHSTACMRIVGSVSNDNVPLEVR